MSADFDTAITALNDGNYEEVPQNKGIIIEELSEAQEKMALNLSKRCWNGNFQNCSDFFEE